MENHFKAAGLHSSIRRKKNCGMQQWDTEKGKGERQENKEPRKSGLGDKSE